MSQMPFPGVNMFRFGITLVRQADATILGCPEPLAALPGHLVDILRRAADAHPDRDFFCQRDKSGNWRKATYADVRSAADSIAQRLIDGGHGPARPLAILSDNSIEQALVMFGAMTARIPVMPVSPAYSLMSEDHEKLKGVFQRMDPSIVFVQNPDPFARALDALDLSERRLLVAETGEAAPTAENLSDWLETQPTGDVEDELSRIDYDTVAKILLTSGSTGMPKGVLNTHLMLVSNQVSYAQVYAFMRDEPPVLVDWLPWNHTFGGNFNVNAVLYNGGTLYIDEGRPLPGRIEETIRNLRDIAPTMYLNVPRGYDLLLPALEADNKARDNLFRRLQKFFFAGAALPSNIWNRLDKLALETRGSPVPITTSLGSTETAPAATYINWTPKSTGNIGVPMPGNEVKLIPNGDKLEVRMRGPNISPGYFGEPELTARAFDDDGYFCIGDAGRFEDEDDPAEGIVFDGRVAENFKLMTGTWVHAGQLRLEVIAAASPVIQDAVVTGADRNEVGLLAFPSVAGCGSLVDSDPSVEDLVTDQRIQETLRRGLAAHNSKSPGSSTRIRRVLLMTEPPQIDAGEITDKGYINQRAVLSRRDDLVSRLYEGTGDDIVFID